MLYASPVPRAPDSSIETQRLWLAEHDLSKSGHAVLALCSVYFSHLRALYAARHVK